MTSDAETIARDALAELGRVVAEQDTDQSLALFTDDALLIGSSVGETAFGATALKDFFAAIHASPTTISWGWDSVVARGTDEIVWFFAEGRVRLTKPGGVDERDYRVAAVLRRSDDRRWRFAMFHGSEPGED
jgi:uncharacterized protein (TIGR02246 family)